CTREGSLWELGGGYFDYW
nr:immunoglobulin heavy chain junction region [Macaca mulatta]